MYYIPEPTTMVSCGSPTCAWQLSYFFDQVTPDRCPLCERPDPARQVLVISTLHMDKSDEWRAA